MSYLLNNQQKLNEIVFANRNKNYGAYVLRSNYGATVLKSLSIMITGFGSIILTLWYINSLNPISDAIKNDGQLLPDSVVYTINLKLPDEIPEPASKKTSEPPASPATSGAATSTLIAQDSLLTDTKDRLNVDLAVSSSTSASQAIATGSFGSTGNDTTGKNVIPEIVPSYDVDSQPEFEGGLRALYGFVGARLRYPEPASDAGKGGTVYVKFVVDETGIVTQLTLLNKLGFGMDEEALRVVSLIPKFKSPAKVRGRAVKSYYQIPIKFSPH